MFFKQICNITSPLLVRPVGFSPKKSNVLGNLSFKMTFNLLMLLTLSQFWNLAHPGPPKSEYVGVSVIPKLSRWFQCDTNPHFTTTLHCAAGSVFELERETWFVSFWVSVVYYSHYSHFCFFSCSCHLSSCRWNCFLTERKVRYSKTLKAQYIFKVYHLILPRSKITYRLLGLARPSRIKSRIDKEISNRVGRSWNKSLEINPWKKGLFSEFWIVSFEF